MAGEHDDIDLSELVDGARAGEPTTLDEVETARRVRLLLGALREAEIEVPADFESRLLARVREDEAVLSLLDLSLSGLGRAFLELLAALFDLLPQPPPAPT